jgi:hypothetical protein
MLRRFAAKNVGCFGLAETNTQRNFKKRQRGQIR